MEVSAETITVLNAELRHKLTPDREYAIRIPKGTLAKFNSVYNDIPETENRPSLTRDRNHRGRHRSVQTQTQNQDQQEPMTRIVFHEGKPGVHREQIWRVRQGHSKSKSFEQEKRFNEWGRSSKFPAVQTLRP